MIFNRDARNAGKKPPIRPMSREKPSDVAMIEGDSAKENASSEKEPKFRVEMLKNCNNEAKPNPAIPPAKDKTKDSPKKASRMLRRKKPKARNVPISTVRFATAPYIVIIAPIVAPVLKMTVTKIPRIRMNLAIISDCSSKNFFSRLAAKYCKRLSDSNAAAISERSSGCLSLNVTVENDVRLNASMI